MGKRKVAQASEAGDAEQKDSAEAGSNEEDQSMEVQPIGEVIKKTGRGRSERKFYEAFELDGVRYNLEDSVLITPEEKSQKPYVAIIKEIKQSKDGSLAITGQWFYRPEEAERKGGGSWVADDARELFYSFHRDEVPAESVMHKCVVHFIPSHKKSPTRTKHPGFIVRKVYDTVEKKLWNLTDKDYEDSKQKEIDLLVQKTRQALGDLPDVEPDQVVAETEKIEKAEKVEKTEKVEKAPRKTLRRKYAPKEDISIPVNDGVTEPGRAETPGAGAETPKAETPGAGKTPTDTQGASLSELLRQGGALIGNKARDQWQEKLLHSVRSLFEPKRGAQPASGSEGGSESSVEKKGEFSPDAAVAAISALEKAAYEAIGDIHKYNLKMRSLEYNLKNGHVLARRLLAKELEASTVVNMSPNELKDGMTAVEKSAQEPEQPQTVQMADVSCGVCGGRQVGVKDIIHAMYGDRYQLECLKCGNSWYAARDSISALTVATFSPSPRVEFAPWVTSKFEEKEVAAHQENDNKEQPSAPNENEKNEKEQPSAPNVNEKNEKEQPSAPNQNEKNDKEQPSAPHENEANEKEPPSAPHENEANEKEQPSTPTEKKPAAETTEINDKEQPSAPKEKENENEVEHPKAEEMEKEGTQDVQMTDLQDEQATAAPLQARSEDAAKGAVKDGAAPAESPAESGEVQDMAVEVPPTTSEQA